MAEPTEPQERRSLHLPRRWTWRQGSQSPGEDQDEPQNNDSEAPRAYEHHEIELPPLPPVQLQGYSETTKSRILDNSELCNDLRNLLPARLQLHESWTLAYSLEQHGTSLHTLYNNVRPKNDKRPGFVLAVKDTHGDVFGAYANEYFRPTESRRFYGNGECFLWKTTRLDDGELRFQAFPYTGVNDFVMFCTPRFLSMGGGDGHYGLWLDDNLETGVTNRSLTFGNDPLCEDGTRFYIVGLEVWCVG